MHPDRKATLIRNVLQAVESRNTAVLKAEQDYSATLRQLLEQAMSPAPISEVPTDAPSVP